MNELIYIDLPVEAIDRIEPLWRKLNEHHRERTTHFQRDYENFTFETRKKQLTAAGRKLKIQIARNPENGADIGYCIASLQAAEGEIESIFVDPSYRGMGIGSRLMREALDWLSGNGIHAIAIRVAVGNEAALPFYEKFGFYPRVYGLKRKAE